MHINKVWEFQNEPNSLKITNFQKDGRKNCNSIAQKALEPPKGYEKGSKVQNGSNLIKN